MLPIKYYETASGRSPIEEFVADLDRKAQEDFIDALVLLERGESLGPPISKPLSSIQKGLHELRIRDRNGIVRIIYYVKKRDAIYVLHAFCKKTQKLPAREKKVILKRLREV